MKNPGKALQMLDWLAKRKDGAKLIEIQQFLWDVNHDDGSKVPAGYWCTNLFHSGLLRTFAEKRADGRWHRNKVKHRGQPFKTNRIVSKRGQAAHRSRVSQREWMKTFQNDVVRNRENDLRNEIELLRSALRQIRDACDRALS